MQTEQSSSSKDVETLKNEIDNLMKEIDIDTIEECVEKLEENKKSLAKLIEKGSGSTKKARLLEDEIMSLELVLSMNSEV